MHAHSHPLTLIYSYDTPELPSCIYAGVGGREPIKEKHGVCANLYTQNTLKMASTGMLLLPIILLLLVTNFHAKNTFKILFKREGSY